MQANTAFGMTHSGNSALREDTVGFVLIQAFMLDLNYELQYVHFHTTFMLFFRVKKDLHVSRFRTYALRKRMQLRSHVVRE